MSTSKNDFIIPVLKVLNDGHKHSLTFLVEKLHTTPTIILDALDIINKKGLASVTKVGNSEYKNHSPIVWLDIDIIYQFSGITPVLVHVIDAVDSTNSFLLNITDNCIYSNDIATVVVAEFQSGGRGRLGRKWHTGIGDSLTFSMSWCFDQDASRLSGLSLVIGIAISSPNISCLELLCITASQE